MSEIVTVNIDRIAINPFRRLHDYPYIESKLAALQRSINDVGLWPSVIARPLQDRLWDHELAFGHHRLEACKRSGLKTIPIIVEHLNDRQMLQYMGRENLEDYNAFFPIQLESWEAALKSGFIRPSKGKDSLPLDIAKLLGWTEIDSGTHSAKGGSLRMNDTARACHAAYAIIQGGYMARDAFASLNVREARSLAEGTLQLQIKTEEAARKNQRPPQETEKFKRHIGHAAGETARKLSEGSVKQRDIRGQLHFETLAQNRDAQPAPLLEVVANEVARYLSRCLAYDSTANNLAEFVKVLPQLELLTDWQALSRVRLELVNLSKRADDWEKRLIPSREKVIHFRALEGKKE